MSTTNKYTVITPLITEEQVEAKLPSPFVAVFVFIKPPDCLFIKTHHITIVLPFIISVFASLNNAYFHYTLNFRALSSPDSHNNGSQ